MQTILCEWQYIENMFISLNSHAFYSTSSLFLVSSQTDVIVNTSTKYCWKSGEVSRAILCKAGQGTERDLEKASANDLVVVTKAHDLSCKEVYHTVCPDSLDDDSAQVEYDLNS